MNNSPFNLIPCGLHSDHRFGSTPSYRSSFVWFWRVFVLLACAIVFLACVTGCGLIPKRVEVGQKRVEAVPEKTPAARESEKQAADYVARKIGEAADAANATSAPSIVADPIADAREVSGALRLSLGPPSDKWNGKAVDLSDRLSKMESRLNSRIDAYRDRTAPMVGKKIEGTGWLQVPYFIWVGGVLLLVWLGWHAVRVFGMLYPPVGVGVAGLQAVGRVPAKVVAKGFNQLVKGGEEFKAALKEADVDDKVRDFVLDLFRRHQMQVQDGDVQNLIRSATK